MTVNAVEQALEGFREGLQADGFTLAVGLTDGVLLLTIRATPEACEDCLVPKNVMQQMVETALSPELGVERIEFVYPTEAGIHDGIA